MGVRLSQNRIVIGFALLQMKPFGRYTVRIGLAQMASVPDVEANRKKVINVFKEAAGQCDLLLFPENVFCLGRGTTVRAAARTEEEWISDLSRIVEKFRVAAVFGGVPIVTEKEDCLANSSLVLDGAGTLLARYDKMHLFRLQECGIDESRLYTHGEKPVSFLLDGWKIGLTICYDLRFPELSRSYAPCDIIVCTAAFTAATGPSHWKPLLRTRAIENQCYVAGVGQCGRNEENGVAMYGHSLMAGPWGELQGEALGDAEELILAELDKDTIEATRARLPALRDIRLAAPFQEVQSERERYL